MFDKRSSKKLAGGTSGQTGNSWFFDFWGEYLQIFGGKSIFFPGQKVIHFQFPTNSLIRANPVSSLLPPQSVFPHIPEVKSPPSRKSKVIKSCLKIFDFLFSIFYVFIVNTLKSNQIEIFPSNCYSRSLPQHRKGPILGEQFFHDKFV